MVLKDFAILQFNILQFIFLKLHHIKARLTSLEHAFLAATEEQGKLKGL